MKAGDHVTVEYPPTGGVGSVSFQAEVVAVNARETVVRSSHTQNLIAVENKYIKQG